MRLLDLNFQVIVACFLEVTQEFYILAQSLIKLARLLFSSQQTFLQVFIGISLDCEVEVRVRVILDGIKPFL